MSPVSHRGHRPREDRLVPGSDRCDSGVRWYRKFLPTLKVFGLDPFLLLEAVELSIRASARDC